MVDFGDVDLGDQVENFAGLLISYGAAFYQHGCAIYPAIETALPRAEFYIGTFALQETLFGFDNDDQEAYQAGMEKYI